MQTIAKILYYGIFVIVLILGLICGRFINKAFSGEIESKDALHVYQFQDGVLLSKHKIGFDANSLDEINQHDIDGWVGGRNDLILSDDATDIYLMKGNQGKWLKGGVKDEPPAQAVLDRWNRKKVMEPVSPLKDGYHEVIKNDNYATEDVGHYPPLQPDLDNIIPPPPAPAPPKYNAEQWYKLPYKDRESIWSSLSEDERMEMLDNGLKLKPRPIVKQLKEKIQEHRQQRYVFQKIGEDTFLLNNEDGRVWKLYDKNGTTKWIMNKDKDDK